MKVNLLTLFPKMIEGFFLESIVSRAVKKNLVKINIINLRDYAIDSYGSVDDKPYGGGAGMLMRVDVINSAVESLKLKFKSSRRKILLTSPRGKLFNQSMAKEFSKLEDLIIICGHYEGVDERVAGFIDEEISLGDFVMTGGEITAVAVVDSVARLIPGVLEKQEATEIETFFSISVSDLEKIIKNNKEISDLKKKGIRQVKLLEYPQYTRPEEYKNIKVPQVLLSGDHKKIREWNIRKAFEETLKKRPDLLSICQNVNHLLEQG